MSRLNHCARSRRPGRSRGSCRPIATRRQTGGVSGVPDVSGAVVTAVSAAGCGCGSGSGTKATDA